MNLLPELTLTDDEWQMATDHGTRMFHQHFPVTPGGNNHPDDPEIALHNDQVGSRCQLSWHKWAESPFETFREQSMLRQPDGSKYPDDVRFGRPIEIKGTDRGVDSHLIVQPNDPIESLYVLVLQLVKVHVVNHHATFHFRFRFAGWCEGSFAQQDQFWKCHKGRWGWWVPQHKLVRYDWSAWKLRTLPRVLPPSLAELLQGKSK